MGLGYLVAASEQASEYSGATHATWDSNTVPAVVTGQTAIVYVAQDGPIPTSVVLSNGDALALLHANPDGYSSIWGVVITTDDTNVTAQAAFSPSENYPSLVLAVYQNMPPAINVLDTGAGSIGSGANIEISGLTNAGSGKFDFLILICSQTDSNEVGVEIHRQFFNYEYRRLAGDSFAQMYDHVGNSELLDLTLEADYPNSSGPKRLCVVIIEAGSTAGVIAALANNRGAIWSAAGQVERPGDPPGIVAPIGGAGWMNGFISEETGGVGHALWFAYDAYIDRTQALCVENVNPRGGTVRLKREGAASLGAAIAVPANETGWFAAEAGSVDFVPANSFINATYFSKDNSIARLADFACRVTPADGVSTISKFMCSGNQVYSQPENTRRYTGILGQLREDENNGITDAYRVGEDYIGAYVCVYIYGNTRTSTSTIIVQQNDGDTSLQVEIPAGELGYFTSGVLMLPGVKNDTLNHCIAFGEGTGELDVRSIQIDLISTNRKFFGGLGNQGRVFVDPRQFPMWGLNNALAGGYATDTKMVAAFTLDKLDIQIVGVANEGGGSLEVYRGEAATGFFVDIPDGVLGWVDVLGALAVSSDDVNFDRLSLLLTRSGVGFDYAVISWAATLLDLSPPNPVIGPLIWSSTPRRKVRHWYRIRATQQTAHIVISGDIGQMHSRDAAVPVRHFVRDLHRLPSTTRRIAIRLESGGGSAPAGIAIAHALRAQRRQGRRVEIFCQDVVASAATVIMCAADHVVIAQPTLVCLHDPHSGSAALLPLLKREAIAIYRWTSTKSEEELAAMMAAVTWMTAAEAVAAGLATEIRPGVPPPMPFSSDSGIAALLPTDVLARVAMPDHLLRKWNRDHGVREDVER